MLDNQQLQRIDGVSSGFLIPIAVIPAFSARFGPVIDWLLYFIMRGTCKLNFQVDNSIIHVSESDEMRLAAVLRYK